MSVLVDTSIWAAHFKQRNEHLVKLLDAGLVVCHPCVVAELACGTPPGRASLLTMLQELDAAPVATIEELLALIDRQSLSGKGCGFVDVALLAATMLSGQAWLWTADKRLHALAAAAGRAYRPPSAA